MGFKTRILYILFVIFMVVKTIVLVNLVKKYCIEWSYVVGQLDAIITILISSYFVIRKVVSC